ncbi:hypothetical protein D3C86_2177970 [compost metagenome]
MAAALHFYILNIFVPRIPFSLEFGDTFQRILNGIDHAVAVPVVGFVMRAALEPEIKTWFL